MGYATLTHAAQEIDILRWHQRILRLTGDHFFGGFGGVRPPRTGVRGCPPAQTCGFAPVLWCQSVLTRLKRAFLQGDETRERKP
jgi:hypothetical protein